MADTANSVIKSKFIARYGPMRAGLGVKQGDTANTSNNGRFWTDIDGVQRPLSTDFVKGLSAAYTFIPAESGAEVVVSGVASLIFTLPKPAVGLRYTLYQKVATTSGIGLNIHPANSEKVYCKGVTAAAGKGLTNTQATAAIGDRVSLISDGTDWFATVTGTWTVEA